MKRQRLWHFVKRSDLAGAIAALEKDVAGSTCSQSYMGSAVRKVAMNSEKVSDHDRSTLWSFVSNGDQQQYAPHSCEICILKQANLTV